MTHIKIEVPANDHIALSAMAEALQRIATERAPSVTVVDPKNIPEGVVQLAPVNPVEAFKTPKGDDFVEIARTDVAFEEVKQYIDQVKDVDSFNATLDRVEELHSEPTPTEQDDTLDADGLPWDNRIHSRGKTRLSDDTWRLARKPNDKTDEEWSEYVESVKSELKAVQDIPTLDEQAVADLTPPVTLTDEQIREEVKEKLESGEVTIEAPLTPPVIDTDTPNGMSEANEAPVAPVTPPTSLTPPVASNQPSVTTFQELMLYITGNAKKRGADNDMIKSTLLEVDPALVAIPLIATRTDLIPKFVTALEAKLS